MPEKENQPDKHSKDTYLDKLLEAVGFLQDIKARNEKQNEDIEQFISSLIEEIEQQQEEEQEEREQEEREEEEAEKNGELGESDQGGQSDDSNDDRSSEDGESDSETGGSGDTMESVPEPTGSGLDSEEKEVEVGTGVEKQDKEVVGLDPATGEDSQAYVMTATSPMSPEDLEDLKTAHHNGTIQLPEEKEKVWCPACQDYH